jgi:hypothetical protein
MWDVHQSGERLSLEFKISQHGFFLFLVYGMFPHEQYQCKILMELYSSCPQHHVGCVYRQPAMGDYLGE